MECLISSFKSVWVFDFICSCSCVWVFLILFVYAFISVHFSTFRSSLLWNSNWEVSVYDFFLYILALILDRAFGMEMKYHLNTEMYLWDPVNSDCCSTDS